MSSEAQGGLQRGRVPTAAEIEAIPRTRAPLSAAEVAGRRRWALEHDARLPLRALDVLVDRREQLDASTATMRAAARFLEERASRPWLLLCGHVGVGKSVAACHAAIELHDAERARVEAGGRAWGPEHNAFVSAFDLEALEPWSPRLRELADARVLLVVDDVGAFGTRKLEAALLPRYDRMRPTVLTSNLNFEAFAAQHERVADRLREIGRVVETAGASMRGNAGARP